MGIKKFLLGFLSGILCLAIFSPASKAADATLKSTPLYYPKSSPKSTYTLIKYPSTAKSGQTVTFNLEYVSDDFDPSFYWNKDAAWYQINSLIPDKEIYSEYLVHRFWVSCDSNTIGLIVGNSLINPYKEYVHGDVLGSNYAGKSIYIKDVPYTVVERWSPWPGFQYIDENKSFEYTIPKNCQKFTISYEAEMWNYTRSYGDQISRLIGATQAKKDVLTINTTGATTAKPSPSPTKKSTAAKPKCTGTNLAKYNKAVGQEEAQWKSYQDSKALTARARVLGLNLRDFYDGENTAYFNWVSYARALDKYATICKMKMRPEWYAYLDDLPVD